MATFALLALLFAHAAPRRALAAGELDAGFGVGGKVTTNLGGPFSSAMAVALQEDGKIVVAGIRGDNSGQLVFGFFVPFNRFALARYLPSGALDPTFGAGGVVVTEFSGEFDEAQAVAIQPSDGKVVVAGSADGLVAVARYLPDGGLDTTFASGGRFTLDLSFQDAGETFGALDEVNDVALQDDGKIVLVGTTESSNFLATIGRLAVVRLHPNGALDDDFGTGGIVLVLVSPTTPTLQRLNRGNAVAIQDDHKIVVAGETRVPDGFAGIGDTDIVLLRFDEAGLPDATFGSSGQVVTPLREPPAGGGPFDSAEDLVIRPDGEIVVVASTDSSGGDAASDDVALLQYTPSGEPDVDFGGGDGLVFLDVDAGVDEPGEVLLQEDGKVVVVGSTRVPGDFDSYDFIVARFDAAGAPDASFGAGGVSRVDFADLGDFGRAGLLQPDGQIVVAGGSRSPAERFALVRLDGGNSEVVSEAVGPSGLVTTDVEGDGVSLAEPAQVSVVTPNPGTVTIERRALGASTPPAGYQLVGQAFDIEAPDGSPPDQPLILTFLLHRSQLGGSVSDVAVVRDGALVDDCAQEPGEVSADPCVVSRTLVGGGDAEIVVQSFQASEWLLARAQPDGVVGVLAPLNVKLPEGKSEVIKKLRVKVTNADSEPREIRVHTLHDCTVGALEVSDADFDKRAPGAQSAILIPSRKSKAALVDLAVRSEFPSVNKAAPGRCHVTVVAETLDPALPDRSPWNNSASFDLTVFDGNDPGQETTGETVAYGPKAVKMTVKKGAQSSVKVTKVKVGNGDILPERADPGHEIHLVTSDGDCPPGTIGAADFDRQTDGTQDTIILEGGKKKVGDIGVMLDGAAITATKLSPFRCTASIAADPTTFALEGDFFNNDALLVIELVDAND